MKSIEIAISYRCNSHCAYCLLPRHRRNESMTADTVVRHMRWARGKGADSVLFSGGEPTISSSLPAFAELASELGFKIIKIRTNGMMLAYPEYVEKLASSGVNRWSVSLKTHEREIHDEMSAVPGGFDLVLKGIENLAAWKLDIECDFLVHALNYRCLEEAAAFFHKRGIRAFNFQLISSYFNPTGELHRLLVALDEAAPRVGAACEWLESQPGTTAITYDFPPCFLHPRERFYRDLKREELMIADLSGHIFPVESAPLHGKSRIRACGGCRFDGICAGLREDYLEIFGESGLMAPAVTAAT